MDKPADNECALACTRRCYSYAGPIIYAKGSHQWPDDELSDYRNRTRNGMSGFLDPINFKPSVEAAAANHAKAPEYEVIELPSGGGVFHGGWTWHGSAANSDTKSQYSLSIHCMPSYATYSERLRDPIESRYKRFGSVKLDESYYPILWTKTQYRSPWLKSYLSDITEME